MSAFIELENLQKSFTTHHLKQTIHPLRSLSFSMEKGEFLGIVGRSGSGKSTIIKCIYRTYMPTGGHIWYDSEGFGRIDLASLDERRMIDLRRHEIGYVSQFLHVMPRMTCLEIVVQSILELGKSHAEARTVAQEALRHFDISEHLWDSYPNTFSGGEKLRLNIARAMVKEPRLLLLDEPTASLDDDSKIKVRQAIEKLKLAGTTMIGIFHDLAFMENVCDSTYQIQSGEMGVMARAK